MSGRRDADGNPAPPWGCGRFVGYDRDGDPRRCEWGYLCPRCDKLKPPPVPAALSFGNGEGDGDRFTQPNSAP